MSSNFHKLITGIGIVVVVILVWRPVKLRKTNDREAQVLIDIISAISAASALLALCISDSNEINGKVENQESSQRSTCIAINCYLSQFISENSCSSPLRRTGLSDKSVGTKAK